MTHDPYRALYIHVPFCVARCAYCDFTTRAVPKDAPEVARYAEELVMQVRRAGRAGELAQVETVYVGGGTPSFAGSRVLSQLFYALGVSMHLTPEVECTVECNPESLDERLVYDLWALGANRLSIGVQSFNDEILRVLGRAHDAQTARDAVRVAQKRFENVSVDLMCGLPSQTLEQFHASLEEAVALGVTHVSVYPLTIEENTPFWSMVTSGELNEPDDDEQAAMMELARDVLERAGFRRYEVASYARPGFECRHNLTYWTGKPYLGLGTSAVSMTQGAGWRARTQDGCEVERLDVRQMCAEDLMLAMRTTRGITEDELAHAAYVLPEAMSVFEGLVRDGLAKREHGHFVPTELGWLCGNELYGRIFELAP